ncbi:thiolase family protein [Nocardia sp. NPDC055165]|uniref:thiolase family protein n=1 Tax=Nocardia sp. NPDC060220 TaxID=3347076 RepID=UPI0036498A73
MTGTAYLADGVRTPFGRYGGPLAEVQPDDLAAQAITALVQRLPSVDFGAVDDVARLSSIVTSIRDRCGVRPRLPSHPAPPCAVATAFRQRCR